jgi:acetyltransferase-like isoleucine patch superfamily enzyme
MYRIKIEFFEFVESLFSNCPGRIGVFFRKLIYKCFLFKCGSGFYTAQRIKIQSPWNVSIGDNVGLNYGVWIASNFNPKAMISIGPNVLIGPYTVIHSGNHRFMDTTLPINKQGFEFKPIIIEEDVWIAAHCTILSGVKIGKGAVVGAGSVVTHDIEPFTVVAGVPARLLHSRIN